MPGKSSQQSIQTNTPVNVFRKGVTNASDLIASSIPMNRGASVNRVQARAIKRQAVNQAIDNQTSRPRPVVRPSAPPQREMPKTRTTRPIRPIRPIASPSASSKIAQIKKSPAPSLPNQTLNKVYSLTDTLPVLNVGSAHSDIATEANALNDSLSELIRRSSFAEVITDAQDLDRNVNHAIDLLDSAREGKFAYQKDLEEIAYRSSERWDSIRNEVLELANVNSGKMHRRIKPLGNDVRNLNTRLNNPTAALPLLRSTKLKVDNFMVEVDQIQESIESKYADIESEVYRLTARLSTIHWALKQLDEARFKLENYENLVMAVPTRWDQEGKDDPEGILYLTDKRLIFERKEKVAKKKVLFIAFEKELIQEVMIDQPITSVKSTLAQSKGLFGHQDFIQLEFSDGNLGVLSLHLDGQDSKDWVKWIEKVRSSEIFDEKVTGSGISHVDLTKPITTADILVVQGEVNQLQDDMMLTGVRQDLAGIENDIRDLERKLSELRARGYVLEKSLETDISVLAMQWDRIKINAETTLQVQVQMLNDQMRQMQNLLSDLVSHSSDLRAAHPIYLQLKSSIASAEAQADAAEDTVVTQYDEYDDEVESLQAYFEWIEWMLDALATASFQLFATESGIAATEAVWKRPGLEPENGILFLTDQRILWEDRMDSFEVKLDLPLGDIFEVSKVVDEENGQQRLLFKIISSMPYPEVIINLNLPVGESWLKMLGRARSGDYNKDRSVEIDRAEIERILNAPIQCSKCGAAFTAPILRGQMEIACEYCGTITRI